MEYYNLCDEFLEIYGVPASKCFIERPASKRESWTYKKEYQNKILSYLQKDYGVVILPFSYEGNQLVLIKTY